MSNTANQTDTTPVNTNPHNLPPALARAQRKLQEPSLATLGIEAFEPAKPGIPHVSPGMKLDALAVTAGAGIVQTNPAPAPNTPPAGPIGNSGPNDVGLAGVQIPGYPANPATHVYIAVFAIKQGNAHKNIKVEVGCTGTPQGDLAAAWAEVRRQFPSAAKNHIVRTSGKISPRAGTGAQAIRLSAGMTVRQLFPDGTEFEAARLVGRISFEHEPHDVILRHIRAKSVFSLTLKPLKGPATINFSEQVSVMRLAAELPAIINQLLGDSGKNLQLYFVS